MKREAEEAHSDPAAVIIQWQMVKYSKLWRELLEIAEGVGIITLGLVTLLILVVAATFVVHFVSWHPPLPAALVDQEVARTEPPQQSRWRGDS